MVVAIIHGVGSHMNFYNWAFRSKFVCEQGHVVSTLQAFIPFRHLTLSKTLARAENNALSCSYHRLSPQIYQ